MGGGGQALLETTRLYPANLVYFARLLTVFMCPQALVDTTDHEIYVNLTCCYNEEYDRVKGSVGTQLVGERAKIILDEVQALSLFTRAQCLQHIGTCSVSYQG